MHGDIQYGSLSIRYLGRYVLSTTSPVRYHSFPFTMSLQLRVNRDCSRPAGEVGHMFPTSKGGIFVLLFDDEILNLIVNRIPPLCGVNTVIVTWVSN